MSRHAQMGICSLRLQYHASRFFNRGFTLIELLVVMGVIVILASLSVPAVGLVRTAALKSKCQSNQRQMIAGVLAYTSENRGFVPYGDFIAGSDWGSALSPGPMFGYVGGEGALEVPASMTWLKNTINSSNQMDLMSRLPVTMCPAVKRIFETQSSQLNAVMLAGGVNLQNIRPNYVTARDGPPNVALNGSGGWSNVVANAGYTKLSDIMNLTKCGVVFCSNFRLDRLGVDLPAASANLALAPFPVHVVRKEPKFGTSYGASFDTSDPTMFKGVINVAYWDGRVAGLSYNAGAGLISQGGSGDVLPAASAGNLIGSDKSLFLKGGN